MRHAYWRKPDGSLHKSDNDKYAPTAILAEIGTTATVQDGAISWPAFRLSQYESAAFPSVAIVGPDGRELNETDSVEMVSNAAHELIKEIGGAKPISPKALLDKVDRKAGEFFRQPHQKRVLVTSVSVEGFPSTPIVVAGCTISAADRVKFPYPVALTSDTSYVTPHLQRTKYQTIAVLTEEATISQAFDAGMTALNFVRGIWNLIATFKSHTTSWSSVPRRKWIGVVHLGPIHAFHNEEGSLLSDSYWYEPDYVEDAKNYKPKEGWEQIEEKRDWTCKEIEASPFKTEVINLLARYATALDQANLDVSFLMLWGILERITNTVGGNYDETIERAIWIYDHRAIPKQLLNQMRWRRNRFVHSAGSTDRRDQLCYITKSFVDEHLLRLIRNDFQVNSLKDHGDFLGLPSNENRLEQLRDWYQRAYELRKSKADAKSSEIECE